MKKQCDACKKTAKRAVTDGYLTICKDCIPKGCKSGYCVFCGRGSILLCSVVRMGWIIMLACPQCKIAVLEKDKLIEKTTA